MHRPAISPATLPYATDAGPDGPHPVAIYDQKTDPDETQQVVTALPCLTADTTIDTPFGAADAGDLRPGDLIMTDAAQPATLRWIAHLRTRLLGPAALVKIGQGVFGATQDLRLSPHAALLFTGWRAQQATGDAATLVRAADLMNAITIRHHASGRRTTLVALMFDRPTRIACSGLYVECAGLSEDRLPAPVQCTLPPPQPPIGIPSPTLPMATAKQAGCLIDPNPIFW